MAQTATVSHLDDISPAAESGMQNVEWQQGAAYPGTITYQGVTYTATLTDISAQVRNSGGVDSRTTTSESIGLASQGMLVTLDNASPIAVTLATVPNTFYCFVEIIGAGTATLTPYSGDINGVADITIAPGDGAILFYDGANWWAVTGGGGGGGGTRTEVALAPGSPGNFQIAHGLGSTPSYALIQMTSGGEIWFQSATRYDATYLYLVASDSGLTGYAEVFS